MKIRDVNKFAIDWEKLERELSTKEEEEKFIEREFGQSQVQTGESEIKPIEEKVEKIPEYRYSPLEKPVKHSDEEVLRMVKDDPINVITNLMLQRIPEYQRAELLLPMIQGAADWMTESRYSPKKGTILYEESHYIMDLLEKILSERDKK